MALAAAIVSYDIGDDLPEGYDFFESCIDAIGGGWIPESVVPLDLVGEFNRIAWEEYRRLINEEGDQNNSCTPTNPVL